MWVKLIFIGIITVIVAFKDAKLWILKLEMLYKLAQVSIKGK
jgi:hypothetical protein